MNKKVGMLIKEARTNAGFTQQELAERIYGLSASDISKAERSEKELSQEQLKAIAKATGVTQKSLLDAAAGTRSSSSKTAKTSSKSTKTNSASTSMKVTAAEKRLVELYRKADANAKKAALKALKDEDTDINDILGSILETAMGSLLK